MGSGLCLGGRAKSDSNKIVVPREKKIREKFCPKCRDFYPLTPEYWGTNSARHDGFESYCKQCRAAYRRKGG